MTTVVVSHDTSFLDKVCTHVINAKQRKPKPRIDAKFCVAGVRWKHSEWAFDYIAFEIHRHHHRRAHMNDHVRVSGILRLKTYKGNITDFVRRCPEAKPRP